METTFISIHDLTPEARVLYSSDSIIDILGYTPDDIVNHSAWDFFPKHELPYAQEFHQKRVSMDKAAVMAYCNVRHRDGGFVGCECCFTVVYDVMIVCTSIYRRGGKADARALAAPVVRRLFSSSPKDPRYHMLSHISAKFAQPSKTLAHEPRAALFLNRFTRTMSIMYATNALEEVIGIPAEDMRGRSFYYCIAENCLQDAVKCLENAKGNDSIAYLRFWFRDPRVDDPAPPEHESDSDEEMTTDMSEDLSDGGVHLQSQDGVSPESTDSNAAESSGSMEIDTRLQDPNNSRTSSGDSANEGDSHESIFGTNREAQSSTSSLAPSPRRPTPARPQPEPIELEAVISCTSDGLVVCLRKARPMIPHPTHRPSQPVYQNGLFAAPWAANPFLPPLEARPGTGYSSAFAPSLGPFGARHDSASPPARVANGPDSHDFMAAIREQAVFAWALAGINGGLADYCIGKPTGDSVPKDGYQVWASDVAHQGFMDGEKKVGNGSLADHERRLGAQMFGDPGLGRSPGGSMSGSGSGYVSGSGSGSGSGIAGDNGGGSGSGSGNSGDNGYAR